MVDEIVSLFIFWVKNFAIPMLVAWHQYCTTHFRGAPWSIMLHNVTHEQLGLIPGSVHYRQLSYLSLLQPVVKYGSLPSQWPFTMQKYFSHPKFSSGA